MDNLSPEQREKLWRRKPAGPEAAHLKGQPELELEASLTDALAQMPNLPVSSNFTARVMDAIDREEAQAARASDRRWNWRALFPRLALATAFVLFAGVAVQRFELVQHHRAEVAQSLRVMASASASTVPDVDALKNFDAIQRMGQSAHADTDLLVALQ